MSILKNNWHWILFSLVMFGGIGVALLTQLNTDTEPKTVYKLPSAETLQNIREKSDAQKVQVSDDTKRPPPPGETHETGYWHGDHWHRTALRSDTKPSVPVAPDNVNTRISNDMFPDRDIPFQKSFGVFPEAWMKLSLEERMNVRVQDLKNFNFPPTPDGYSIKLRSLGGFLKLDENDNPILHKDYEPYFDVLTEIGFAPTREEYEHYQELLRQHGLALGWERTAEAERLSTEIDAFRLSCFREIPDIAISLKHPHGTTESEVQTRLTRAIRIQRQLLYEEYRKAGFDYLIPEDF